MNTRKKTMSLTKLLFIEFIIMVIASVAVFHIEAVTTESEKKEEIFQKLNHIKSSVTQSNTDIEVFGDAYDGLFTEEAQAIAYAHNHIDGFEITKRINDADENTIIHVNPETKDDTTYYTAQCEDGTVYALEYVENDYSLINLTFNVTSDQMIQEILSQNDLIIEVSGDGTIELYPTDDNMEEKNISELGFDLSDLVLEDAVNLTIKGENYYTASTYDEENDSYFIYAVKSHIFNANNRICAFLICAAMFIVVTMVVTYSYFTRQEKNAADDKLDKEKITSNRKNPWIIGIIGLLIVTIITFHIQSLFSLSVFSMQKNNELLSIKSITDRQENRFTISNIANEFTNKQKLQLIASLLSDYPELRTKEHLVALKSIFNVPFICIYDSDMNELMNTYDYKDQYKDYENTIIFPDDSDYLIPKDKIENLTHDISFTYDNVLADDNTTYYISMGAPLDIYSPIVENLQVENILKEVSNPDENEIAAIDPDSKIITYSSLDGFYGLTYNYMGLTEEDMQNRGYNQIQIDGERYYYISNQISNYMIFLMQAAEDMFDGRMDITIATTILTTLCIVFLLFLLGKYDVSPLRQEQETNPDSRLAKIYSFFEIDKDWSKKTAEEKAMTIARSIFHVLSFIIIAIVLFRNSINDENTIFGFVLKNQWAKGLNLFSLTAIAVVWFVYNFIVTIVQFLFRKMFVVVSNKSETFLRLLRSFLLYSTVLALIFYCLYLLGLNPTSLLASAGLASFVISLGAKDLITDVLAGLFIIFEDQFQVDEMIQVGPDLGFVREIGVRTTRVQTIPGDILCISNRNLTNVVNKTRTNTTTSLIFSVSYKQNIAAIEDMLREEVPKLKSLSENFLDVPEYKGILDFNERYARMIVNFTTTEPNRFTTTCMMNTEICRLFDEHGFQLGIKPVEYKK